jgi:hypothetical protein
MSGSPGAGHKGAGDGTASFDLTCLARYYSSREMDIRKIIVAVLLLTLGTALPAQDLVAAAKKEKERRAALKSKPSIKVTNKDLEKSKKKAAISPTEAAAGSEENPAGEEAPPAEPERKPTAVAAGAEETVNVDTGPDPVLARAELEERYNRAKEHLDYLDLKMRALMQQLYSFNSMESKEKVQRDIADTRVMFEAAKVDEAKLKKELEDFSPNNPVK